MSTAAVPYGGIAAADHCPQYPARIESLPGVLHLQHELMPERVVCQRVVRRRDGIRTDALTVRALIAQAERAAGALRLAGVRADDRVILSLSDPHDFLVSFFATLAAGATAVPLPTVAEAGAPRSFAARIRAVCGDCEPRAAVVEDDRRFAEVVGALPTHLVVRTPRALLASACEREALRDRPAASAALIQYTSGSTGQPKGVVVTHGNIVANCRAIRDATGYTRADRMVSWLPLHHDMGLVGGLLTSIYCAAETCLMSPLAFLGRPVTWLEAISHCRAALTVAPTFAYSLCARKLPDAQLAGIDLSSLRLAYIGAEPIDTATVDAFIERFTPYGLSPQALYPVYGLAEATLAVSFPAPGAPLRRDRVERSRLATDAIAVPTTDVSDSVTFVSVGQALPDHTIQICCRDMGTVLGERCVGEIVVAGDSVSPRYFGEPSATARQWLHTGDLAYVAEGQLYVVDRIKDLIVIAGQNYAPSDIESAVASIADLRRGRIVAFSAASSAGTEALHVVAEPSPETRQHPDALAAAVRRAVQHEIGLAVASVTLVVPGTLERTSSGKIKRRACADAWRAGTLHVVRSRADLAAYRWRRRRQRLGRWLSGLRLSG